MTPKEIAQEIFNKFYQEAPLQEINFYSNDVMAKNCALISVNEFLDFLSKSQYDYVNTIAHWQQVKQEIKNL